MPIIEGGAGGVLNVISDASLGPMADDPDTSPSSESVLSESAPSVPGRDPATGLVTPPPVQMNARRIVAAGTLIWFVAFVALLPFYGWLGRHDHRLWLWSCLAGTALGVLGWSLMTRHRRMGRTI